MLFIIKDLSLQAVNNVSISADTNYFKDTHFEQKSKSGVFSGGGIGITFGKQSETHESEAEGWQQSQARSTLGSLSGNVSVKAGNHAHLSGTDLIASKELDKAITIEGKSTYIGASRRCSTKYAVYNLTLSEVLKIQASSS